MTCDATTQVERRLVDPLVGTDTGHQAGRPRVLGGDGVAGEHDLGRASRRAEHREQRGRRRRDHSEHDLGLPEARPLAGYHQVGALYQLESAAEAAALHGGHHGDGEVAEPGNGLHELRNQFRVVGRHVLTHVRPSREVLTLSTQEQYP